MSCNYQGLVANYLKLNKRARYYKVNFTQKTSKLPKEISKSRTNPSKSPKKKNRLVLCNRISSWPQLKKQANKKKWNG